MFSYVSRDEIYCMVLRQLTNNPQKIGRLRGWTLLGLIVGIFLPSDKVQYMWCRIWKGITCRVCSYWYHYDQQTIL